MPEQTPFRIPYTRVGRQAAHQATWVRDFAARQPSWLVRAAIWAVALASVLVALLVLIPLTLLALTAFTAFALAGWLRSLLPARARPDPEGRRNVRILPRQGP